MLSSELQPEFRDMICLDNTIQLSHWDAFKALLGYPIHCEVRVSTENVIGKTQTQSESHVPQILWRLRAGWGGGEMEAVIKDKENRWV